MRWGIRVFSQFMLFCTANKVSFLLFSYETKKKKLLFNHQKYINYERFSISVGVVSWQREGLIFNFSFFQKPYVLKKKKK